MVFNNIRQCQHLAITHRLQPFIADDSIHTHTTHGIAIVWSDCDGEVGAAVQHILSEGSHRTMSIDGRDRYGILCQCESGGQTTVTLNITESIDITSGVEVRPLFSIHLHRLNNVAGSRGNGHGQSLATSHSSICVGLEATAIAHYTKGNLLH